MRGFATPSRIHKAIRLIPNNLYSYRKKQTAALARAVYFFLFLNATQIDTKLIIIDMTLRIFETTDFTPSKRSAF